MLPNPAPTLRNGASILAETGRAGAANAPIPEGFAGLLALGGTHPGEIAGPGAGANGASPDPAPGKRGGKALPVALPVGLPVGLPVALPDGEPVGLPGEGAYSESGDGPPESPDVEPAATDPVPNFERATASAVPVPPTVDPQTTATLSVLAQTSPAVGSSMAPRTAAACSVARQTPLQVDAAAARERAQAMPSASPAPAPDAPMPVPISPVATSAPAAGPVNVARGVPDAPDPDLPPSATRAPVPPASTGAMPRAAQAAIQSRPPLGTTAAPTARNPELHLTITRPDLPGMAFAPATPTPTNEIPVSTPVGAPSLTLSAAASQPQVAAYDQVASSRRDPAVFVALADESPAAGLDLQTFLAMREGQPVVTASAAAPASAPQPPQPAPHDFAALVERLVEARDTAMPHIVRTAIGHGEFGKVTLSFQPVDGGMAVRLASPDPAFAPAVQAAIATNTDSDAARQQPGSQQSQAQSQSQPHAQHQPQSNGNPQGNAQGGTREPGARSPSPASAEDALSVAGAEPRGARDDGIFA